MRREQLSMNLMDGEEVGSQTAEDVIVIFVVNRLEWAEKYMKTDMELVIFTDEKRATLDRPDRWGRGWVANCQKPQCLYIRQISNQCQGKREERKREQGTEDETSYPSPAN